MGTFKEEKILLSLPRIEKQFPSESACGVVTVLITLSELPTHVKSVHNGQSIHISLTVKTG